MGGGYGASEFVGAIRAPVRKNPLQPACLQRSHLFATPSSRASMLRFGRGSAAAATGGGTPSKVSLLCLYKEPGC